MTSGTTSKRSIRLRFGQLALATACVIMSTAPAFALTINPTFTANFVTDFGANAVAAENAWKAAAAIFTSNFSDPVTINITVEATAGTSPFGESFTNIVGTSYANLRTLLIADAKTPDDLASVGAGGSVTAADPTGGNGNWFVSRAEAKAIGLIPTDGVTDGTTEFGAANPFSFSGVPPAGQYDFEGVAAHEIAEVMGRIGLGGNGGNYTAIDLFDYLSAGTRDLASANCPHANGSFSIDNGTTLLKLYNNHCTDNLDTKDWAPSSQGGSGAPDSFNQFSDSGVVNGVTGVDLREMDVIGYDRIIQTGVPEPATLLLLGTGLVATARARKRSQRKS